MRKVEKSKARLIFYLSVSVAFIIIVFDFLFLFTSVPLFDYIMIVAVWVVVTPYAIIDFNNRKWRKSMEKAFPLLLRNIAEAQRTGLTFIRALEESSKREYGPLSEELRKVCANISWGEDYVKALESFAENSDSELIKKGTALIIETGKFGGNIEKITEAIASHIMDVESMDRERSASMKQYTMVTYIAFFVFIFTIIVLFKVLFVQFAQSGTQLQSFGSINISAVNVEEIKRVFMHLCVIQGFSGGLIGGKLSEGSIGAGLKHSLILTVLSVAIFAIVM
jgi:flagellar protein FlaJ